jgi:hypothetical protein
VAKKLIKTILNVNQITQYTVLHDDLNDTDKYIMILDGVLSFVKENIK